MTIIKNGGHDGDFGMLVKNTGHAQTDAITQPEDKWLNLNHEKVWSLPFEGIDPVGADDYFLYIKNIGSTNLAITDFRLESSVIGTVEVHSVSGTASYTADVDVTPVNRHTGSSVIPAVIVKTDTDTTGLTNNGVLFWINLDTADKLFHEKTTANVIIPPGQAIALLWDQATGVEKGMLSLVELV